MKNHQGFTLIELSIVLVIIGLIVGGILVGRDLITAATLNVQITQIQKYNTAADTFRGKYGYLPGDIIGTEATKFGFVARAGGQGRGDGDGILWGINYNTMDPTGGSTLLFGETALFWRDLSTSNLISDSLTTAIDSSPGPSLFTFATTPYTIKTFIPMAKLGTNMVYVYSWQGVNYFGISFPTVLGNDGVLYSTPGLTVAQAAALDAKIDDGLPTKGNIQAFYVNSWASASMEGYTNSTNGALSATTCYDTTSYTYSLSVNNGTGVNCALSIKLQ